MLLLLIATVEVSLPVLFWTARSLDARRRAREPDAERFESVLRAATEHSIVGTDTDGTITVFNEGAERMLGYAAEELVGRETPAVIHDPARSPPGPPSSGSSRLRRVRRCRAREPGGDARMDVRPQGRRARAGLAHRHRDARSRRDAGRVHRDGVRPQLETRARARAPAARPSSPERSSAAPPSASTRRTRDGSCIFVNAKWQELAGRSEEAALGDGWLDALHPDDAADVTSAWESFTRGISSFAAEYRLQRPDGSRVWVAGQAVALRGDKGETLGFLGTILDVTQRREAQAQRERLLAESRAVLDATTDGILMTDLRGEVLFSNAAMGNSGRTSASWAKGRSGTASQRSPT